MLRTRRALHSALISLLEERPYEAITIADICNKADVGRSAFYEHFAGKDDLFRLGFKDLDEELAAAVGDRQNLDTTRTLRLIVEALFRHAGRHSHLYRAMSRSHAGHVADMAIASITTPHLKSVLEPADDPSRGIQEFRLAMTQRTLLAALHWWLERSARMDIDKLVDELMPRLLGGADSTRTT